MMSRRLWTSITVFVAAGVIAGAATPAAQAQDAKQVYDKSCAMCHGVGGKADGPASKAMKPPPQPFVTALSGASDADIAKVIKEGGKAAGKAASMPAYGSKLSDEQIQGLVQYIKGLK